MNNIRDTFQLSESKYSTTASEVDGKYIIGKVTGESFVPGGFSRNKRFYPESLWEKVVADPAVRRRLEDRTMYGSIGHEVVLNDAAFRNGDFTHIVSDIRIEEGKGVADYLILGTPAGRNLDTILRAGSKVYVSSRADGAFVEGKSKDGMPIVDGDKYQFETFDFVLDPGFLQASPALAEAYTNLFPTESQKSQESPMATDNSQFLEALNSQKDEIIAVSGKLTLAMTENQQLAGRNTILESENTNLTETVAQLREAHDAAKNELRAYNALGNPSDITVIVESLGDVIASFDGDYNEEVALGEQLEELQLAAFEGQQALEVFAEADLADEGDGLLDTAEKLVETFNAVDQVVEFLETNGLKTAEESLMQVAEKMVDIVKVSEAKRVEEATARVAKLAAELKVPEEKIKAVEEKSDEDIRAIYADVKQIAENNAQFANLKKPEGSTGVPASKPDFKEAFNRQRKLGEQFGFK